MKKYHYIYKITNLNPQDERKYYIGVRSAECIPEKDTSYWSSSKPLKAEIEKLGIDNFYKEIISVWETRKDAIDEEVRLHYKYNVSLNESFYNIAKQTSTKFDTSGLYGEDCPSFGRKHSDEYKKNSSMRQQGSNNTFYGKHHSDEAKKSMSKKNKGEGNGFYGKKHTEETLKKIRAKSGTSKNTRYMFNESMRLTKRVKEDNIQEHLNNGWEFGRRIFK